MQATQLHPGTSAGFLPGVFVPADSAGVGLADLTGFDIVSVLKAQYRAQARQRALVFAAVWETSLREAGSADYVGRMARPDEWSADEVRAALGLTRTAAENLLGLAEAVCVRLPELHAAMAAGELDEPRARLLAEWTADLSDEHPHGICDALLDAMTAVALGESAPAADTAAAAFVEAQSREFEALNNASPEQLRSLAGGYAAAAAQEHTSGVIADHNQDLREIDAASTFTQDVDRRVSDAT